MLVLAMSLLFTFSMYIVRLSAPSSLSPRLLTGPESTIMLRLQEPGRVPQEPRHAQPEVGVVGGSCFQGRSQADERQDVVLTGQQGRQGGEGRPCPHQGIHIQGLEALQALVEELCQ